MTVGELIKELQKYDAALRVTVIEEFHHQDVHKVSLCAWGGDDPKNHRVEINGD